MTPIISIVILSLIGGLIYVLLTVGRRDTRLPPGPPTLPIIGNIHQLPVGKSFLKYAQLAKTYGGLFSLKVGPSTVAFITDRRIARELLDKKSSVTNNRPPSYVGQTLIGNHDQPLMLPNGPNWRTNRRLYHQNFMESVVDKNYLPIVHAESSQLLKDILIDPGSIMDHYRRFGNSIMTSIMYGVRASSINAPYMTRYFEAVERHMEVAALGATPPVDIFPFLKYIPERFLGNWVSKAQHVNSLMEVTYTEPLKHVIQRRKTIGNRDTFMDRVLGNDKFDLDVHRLAFVGGGISEAGSDTTATMLMCFMQAMVKWPEIQYKAQRALDAVVGDDRTPKWSDYGSLPYIAAIVKECMRWRPATPLGVPHYLDQDEWIDGQLLPKNTTLILNVWGLHHDEHMYSHPDIFDPERYIDKTLPAAEYAKSSDYSSRDHYGYGAGRRLCPGLHLADRSMFIGMAKLLWAYHFEKSIDPVTGTPIEPDTDPVTGYAEGLVLTAKAFPCKITVRSEARRETILREFSQAEAEVFAKFEDDKTIEKMSI